MAVNRVVYGTKILIDLTSDTVTPDVLFKGCTAHKADGTIIVGTAFEGYPNVYVFCDLLKDSNGDSFKSSSGNVVEGRTVYRKL